MKFSQIILLLFWIFYSLLNVTDLILRFTGNLATRGFHLISIVTTLFLRNCQLSTAWFIELVNFVLLLVSLIMNLKSLKKFFLITTSPLKLLKSTWKKRELNSSLLGQPLVIIPKVSSSSPYLTLKISLINLNLYSVNTI